MGFCGVPGALRFTTVQLTTGLLVFLAEFSGDFSGGPGCRVRAVGDDGCGAGGPGVLEASLGFCRGLVVRLHADS